MPDRAGAEDLRSKASELDRALAESVLAARRRVQALERLDARLEKPPSSLGWAVKTS
jgi:hypothetical protein